MTTWSASRPELVAGERLILVYGNCQAHWLAGVLAAQGVGLVAVVGAPFGFYPECQGIRPFFVDADEAATLIAQSRTAGRPVAILEQTSPLHAGLDGETRQLGDQLVQFPHLEVRAYWHPWLTKVGDGFDHDRIRRQFQFDLAAIRRSSTKAGWTSDLAGHLEQSHRDRLQFHTLNHPSGDLMQRLHAGICDALAESGPVSQAGRDWAQAEIGARDGMSFIAEHPLHDAVISALDLKWARTGWYAQWQKAYFLAGEGRHAEALKLLEAALADPACDPHVHYNLGIVLNEVGDAAGSLAAFGAAYRAYPQNLEYGRRWLGGFARPEPVEDHILMERLKAGFPV